jgi:hypothetical protein
MNPNFTRKLFYRWFQFMPTTARNWLNRKLMLATNYPALALWRDAQAANELELQCEAAGLAIRR